MAKKTYRYIREVPGSLENGRPVAPGEYVELTAEEQGQNQQLGMIERGALIEVDPSLATTEPETTEQPEGG